MPSKLKVNTSLFPDFLLNCSSELQTIKRLEREINKFEGGYLVIPIMATPEEAEAIRQEAKRQNKKTLGEPIKQL